MSLPLEGVLVVAVEQAVAAPLCTARLADAGARVIKIERPGGDFARGYDRAARGDSSYFAWTNHGKESLVLDFKQPDDARLLARLIADADVLVQNLAPGALARSGFDMDDLRERHPRLITADISGYGSGNDVPDDVRDQKAYDLLVQAESGLVSVSGAPGEPGRIGVSLCDIGAGVTAWAGILEALIRRGVTGRGGHVSVSLFDVAAEWMTVPLVHAETGNGAPERVGLKHPSITPYGAFPDSEGQLTLISIQNEAEWGRLCTEVLQAPQLANDPRFGSNTDRVRHRDDVDKAVAERTAALSTTELRGALQRASIAFGSVNSVADLARHDALRRRSVSSSTGEPLSLPAHPVRASAQGFGATRPASQGSVPRVGEHSDAIRAEFAD